VSTKGNIGSSISSRPTLTSPTATDAMDVYFAQLVMSVVVFAGDTLTAICANYPRIRNTASAAFFVHRAVITVNTQNGVGCTTSTRAYRSIGNAESTVESLCGNMHALAFC
jgi:hypothetical protein